MKIEFGFMVNDFQQHILRRPRNSRGGAPNKAWWGYLVVLLYAVLLFSLVPKHEPWLDEAQAWLLARDSSLTDLFATYLRYEGSPGLWHLILMLPAKFGLPYITLNFISGVLAIIGVALVVFYSPFPAIVRAIYPFTYFVFYQYAIVARSYVLMSLILSLIAVIYPRRRERLYLFTALLMLLGSVSVHSLLVAFGLIVVEALEALSDWRKLQRDEKNRYIISMLAVGIFLILSFLILLPPKDHSNSSTHSFDPINFLKINVRMIYDFLTGNRYLSILLFSALVWWFIYRKKLLILLATMLPIFAIFGAKYAAPHHAGVLFIVLIFNLWLSYEAYRTKSWKNIANIVVLTAILVIFSIHIYWSVGAYRYDLSERYSASREVADYLRANKLENQKIAAIGIRTLSILPYFNKNIFANLNSGRKPSFWVWSNNYNTEIWSPQDKIGRSINDKLQVVLKETPDAIIISVPAQDDPSKFEVPAYKLAKYFPGKMYFRDKAGEPDSFAILLRDVGQVF